MIFTIGLALITIGWAFQAYRTLGRKDRQISPVMLLFYSAGVALLVTGNFMGGDTTTGALNLLDFILPVVVLAGLLVMNRRK